MSDFDSSQWADSEFSQEYRKYANDYLPDRFKLIEIVKSFSDTLFMRSMLPESSIWAVETVY